jgi:hypothetical protein
VDEKIRNVSGAKPLISALLNHLSCRFYFARFAFLLTVFRRAPLLLFTLSLPSLLCAFEETFKG